MSMMMMMIGIKAGWVISSAILYHVSTVLESNWIILIWLLMYRSLLLSHYLRGIALLDLTQENLVSSGIDFQEAELVAVRNHCMNLYAQGDWRQVW